MRWDLSEQERQKRLFLLEGHIKPDRQDFFESISACVINMETLELKLTKKRLARDKFLLDKTDRPVSLECMEKSTIGQSSTPGNDRQER